MDVLSSQEARERIRRRLKALSQERAEEHILLGVTGCVASGKSRFCAKLRADAEVILQRPIVYLPFDLWIDANGLDGTRYAERFFMNDLIQGVRCIRRGERFFVPRHDIVKSMGCPQDAVTLSTQEVLWNGKTFRRCAMRPDPVPIDGELGLYIEAVSGHPYSLVAAPPKSCVLLDGTLVAPPEARPFYDLVVFVKATWPLRVARMIRRYNRKEVFGATRKSMSEYVGFLVSEARQCADAEIGEQRSAATIVVESVPDTLSNYLDLAYLRGLLRRNDGPHWASADQVDAEMDTFRRRLRELHDADRLAKFREELVALMESKHLLALQNADAILADLASILGS